MFDYYLFQQNNNNSAKSKNDTNRSSFQEKKDWGKRKEKSVNYLVLISYCTIVRGNEKCLQSSASALADCVRLCTGCHLQYSLYSRALKNPERNENRMNVVSRQKLTPRKPSLLGTRSQGNERNYSNTDGILLFQHAAVQVQRSKSHLCPRCRERARKDHYFAMLNSRVSLNDNK